MLISGPVFQGILKSLPTNKQVLLKTSWPICVREVSVLLRCLSAELEECVTVVGNNLFCRFELGLAPSDFDGLTG